MLQHQVMYVKPLTHFEGVTAEVAISNGTYSVWFPIMEHCSLNNSKWGPVLLKVEKHTSLTLNVTLRVYNCLLSCELTAKASHTSKTHLQLQNMTLYGKGPSKWKEQRPLKACGVETEAKDPIQKTLSSCTNHQPISEVLILWVVSVVVVVVVITMVVVVVLLMKRRRGQRENGESSQQVTHSTQQVTVTTRNSLYEPLDQYRQ